MPAAMALPLRVAHAGGIADAETRVRGVLEAHAEDGADATLDPAAVTLLGRLFTPSRYLCHGFQQVEAYLGYMAPSSYITNAAAFASADFLRRVTTIAYRTRELQIARPDSGIGSAERSLWEGHEGWQPARKAVEYALVSYDFGEAFTALNLQASALDEGDLDGETLTCAKHLWEFNARTGRGINPDDAELTSYGCQVGDDGTIYVDIGR